MPDIPIEGLAPLLVDKGFRVLGAIAVLVVGLLAAKAARRWGRRALTRSKLDNTLTPFLSNLIYYAVVIFTVIAVLGMFGVQTASLIAVMGAAAFAVGMALQGTLGNFAAGIMLLVLRPFRIGDFVEVGGSSGTVMEIGLFSTTMNTPDNLRVIVPNGSVFGSVIKNYSTNDTRRLDLVMGIHYEDDIGLAIETIRRVVTADSRVLAEPVPVFAVQELGDSSVNLIVRPWCQRTEYWALRWDLTRSLKEELEKAGCSIPFPQRDVHLYQESSSGNGSAT